MNFSSALDFSKDDLAMSAVLDVGVILGTLPLILLTFGQLNQVGDDAVYKDESGNHIEHN